MSPRARILLRIGAVAAVLWVAYQAVFAWPTDRQLTLKQERLLHALATNDRSDLAGLVSYQYTDRWGFDRLAVIDAMGDMARQFIHLEIDWTETDRSVTGRSAVLRGTTKLRGQGPPVGQQILSLANRINTPFAFAWEKESWTPWSWRLVQVDHPDLEVPSGYTPGQNSSFLDRIEF